VVETAEDGLHLFVPGNSVVTVRPHGGTNLPPTVVRWEAIPSWLRPPRSEVRLHAAATDPERDTLTYSWAVVSWPDKGRAPRLRNARRPDASASGLDVPGRYVFRVEVSDGRNTVQRFAAVQVFVRNQPPVLIDVHNRIPVVVTLPRSSTELRGGALDLEGDRLRMRWSVVRKPQNANVHLATPDKGRCRVSGLTVPGTYVFRFTVDDGENVVSQDLETSVYPVNRAPVIRKVTATPQSVSTLDGAAVLSVEAGDPDHDVCTVWWRVLRAPAGASPVFERPGAPTTRVGA